jgi:methyl-accepting chemotaxis protein
MDNDLLKLIIDKLTVIDERTKSTDKKLSDTNKKLDNLTEKVDGIDGIAKQVAHNSEDITQIKHDVEARKSGQTKQQKVLEGRRYARLSKRRTFVD